MFFREDATIEEDKLSGGITFIIAIIILVASTMGMIALIKFLLHGLSVRVVHAVTRCNGYFGILLGGAATVFVQSSQAVVSIMVPFAGVGALPLETIYPIVVGSNVGTALQTVMTSMSAFGPEPLQVALAHLFFNVTGMLLWYPIPHLRAVPLWAARRLGQGAKTWRLFPILSILGLYIVIPLLTFGLLELYQSGGTGARVFVILVFVGGGLALGAILYWCKYRGGDEKYLAFVGRLSSRRRGGRGGQSVATDPSYNGGDDWDVRKSLAEAAAFTGSPRKSARSLGNSLRSSFQSLTGLPPVLTATPTSPKTSMPLPSLPLPPLERSTHSKLSECFADSVISIDEDWDKDPITF